MSEMQIRIKFSKQIANDVLEQLKNELTNGQKIPEKLKQIFKPLDNDADVTIEIIETV